MQGSLLGTGALHYTAFRQKNQRCLVDCRQTPGSHCSVIPISAVCAQRGGSHQFSLVIPAWRVHTRFVYGLSAGSPHLFRVFL